MEYAAFCLVGAGHGGQAILQSLVDQPGLSSFVVIADPTPSMVERCGTLLHPGLLACNGGDENQAAAKAARAAA